MFFYWDWRMYRQRSRIELMIGDLPGRFKGH